MVWSQIKGKSHDCSGPCCCGVFVSVSCGRWTHRQHRVERYRQREQWSCTDPGPVRSHSAFWGWKEKTSLRAADHASTPPVSLLPNPISLPTPFSSPLYLPASLPHSQPVACSRACPSQKRGSRLPKKTSHPMAGLCCGVHRERRGGRWRDRVMAYMVWAH